MKYIATCVSIFIGTLLILYAFTLGEIWNNHYVQSYLILCTGIISINFGMLGIILCEKKQ